MTGDGARFSVVDAGGEAVGTAEITAGSTEITRDTTEITAGCTEGTAKITAEISSAGNTGDVAEGQSVGTAESVTLDQSGWNRLVVAFDAGWQKRGTGHQYNSLTGKFLSGLLKQNVLLTFCFHFFKPRQATFASALKSREVL